MGSAGDKFNARPRPRAYKYFDSIPPINQVACFSLYPA